MADAHELDREAAEAGCRSIIQPEDETEAIELARTHVREDHGQDSPADERRAEHLQVV